MYFLPSGEISYFQARSGMMVCPSFGSRRSRVSYIGLWGPMLATVPDWCTSKWAGALWTAYRRVPPRLAAGSTRMGDAVSWASARWRRMKGPTAAAPPTAPAVWRKRRRLWASRVGVC